MRRKSVMFGRTTVGEWDTIWHTPSMQPQQPAPEAVLFFHGSGANAFTMSDYTSTDLMGSALSRGNVHVVAADFGYQTWGNSVLVGKSDEVMTWLAANGLPGPYIFVGGSMGMTSACATAFAYPEKCAGIAGIIPLMSLQGVISRGHASEVNSAYGGAYDDDIDGPAHSPMRMATTLPADLPMHLWCGSVDPSTPLYEAEQFVSLRPQTGLTILQGHAHTNEAIIAATPDLSRWVRDVRRAQ